MYPWHIVDKDLNKIIGVPNEEAAILLLLMLRKGAPGVYDDFAVLEDDIYQRFLAQETDNG